MNRGVAAFKSGDPQSAADSFTRALELDPDLTAAELYLGATYASMATAQNTEMSTKAIQSFERVLEKQPENQEAASRLASVYLSVGDLGKARGLYIQLTKASPLNATAFYSLGAVDWTLSNNKQFPLPAEDRKLAIDEGLQNVAVALALNPQYADAMVYRNLLLREKAEITSDPAERARLISEADSWFSKAIAARAENLANGVAAGVGIGAAPPPQPPAPPPAPAQRIGSQVAQANLVRRVAPVYPPLARAAQVQGVVLLETSIDKTGRVADVSVLSGHPLLNDAAVQAVQQWTYQPVLLNGQPVDVVTTVTVNFVLQ
jgi:TonB family protein